jgi:hypothetical protein
MKPTKHAILPFIVTAVVSFGAGYLAAGARGPQPQGFIPAPVTLEQQNRLIDPGMRRALGLDATPYPKGSPKTWLTGE